MNTEREEVGAESFGPRSRSGARRPVKTTSRWVIGRLIRIAREAGCRFVRAPTGGIVYFALADLAGGEGAAAALRPGTRMRFQPAGHGVPRALAIAAV